ncbi:hypothetical protein PDE_05141 [Penicillium oxalicum 114-2]|uniref:Uncharacterized protein n=1 Tax=Penicillium oxalicum (strain 114-2 / CGMCC 5302) TaxID=933388 RepID=S7ZNC4_PENO1|nr:hypothetical protein PDE_05141 [Penicillium oxalicum 114-2]
MIVYMRSLETVAKVPSSTRSNVPTPRGWCWVSSSNQKWAHHIGFLNLLADASPVRLYALVLPLGEYQSLTGESAGVHERSVNFPFVGLKGALQPTECMSHTKPAAGMHIPQWIQTFPNYPSSHLGRASDTRSVARGAVRTKDVPGLGMHFVHCRVEVEGSQGDPNANHLSPPSSYFDVDSNEAEPGTLAVANMNSLPRSPDRVSCRGSTFDTYDMDEMGTGRTFWTNTGQDGFAFMCDLRGHRTYESVVYPCPIILADCFATLCHVM